MISYSDLIELYEPFSPASGAPDLEVVIEALIDDTMSKRFTDNYPLPQNPIEKRRWVQAALTIRPAGSLSNALANAMDRILQAELSRKIITDASDLPRLNTAYPISDKVSIWNGDISTLHIGAITNAANAQMLGCFQPYHACIDNVIQCAAGPQLREDCQRIMEDQGHEEKTGTAKITRAYNLPSRFVLHTVGPIVSDHRPTPEQAKQLANCYRGCLSLCAEANVRSLAFCGISTGVFGYPADRAARVALSAVADWMRQNPDTIDHIVFNTYGEVATSIYTSAVDDWAAGEQI